MTSDSKGRSPSASRSTNVGWTAMGAAALVAVTLVVGWFGFAMMYDVGVGNPSSAGTSTTGSASSAPPTPVAMYLAIVTTPGGMDQYLPANFSVPINTPINFEIANYDNGVNNVSSSVTQIQGTTDGTESVQGGIPGGPQGAVSSLPIDDISHTFSIVHGPQTLNALMPPAVGPNQPTIVTFTVVFTTAGTFTWMCQAPCDPGSMAVPGFMSGTITVN